MREVALGNRPIDVDIVTLEERVHLTSSAWSADCRRQGRTLFQKVGSFRPKVF